MRLHAQAFVFILSLLFLCSINSLYAQRTATFEKTFANGGGSIRNTVGSTVLALPDKGFLISGMWNYGFSSLNNNIKYPDYRIHIIRTDSLGAILWEKDYYDTTTNFQNTTAFIKSDDVTTSADMVLSPEGNIVVCSNTLNSEAFYLFKITQSGKFIWSKYLQGKTNHGLGIGMSITNDPPGGYILAGASTILSSKGEACLIKTDTAGKVVWSNTYNKSGIQGWAYKAIPSRTGGYLLCGTAIDSNASNALGYSCNYLVLKTDKNGTLLWSKVFGASYTSMSQRFAHSIVELPDNSIYVCGTDSISGALMKLDGSGNILWSKTYNNTPKTFYTFRSALYDSVKHVINISAGLNVNNTDSGIGILRVDTSGKFISLHVISNLTYKQASHLYSGFVFSKAAGHDFLHLSSGAFIFLQTAYVTGNNAIQQGYFLVKTDSGLNIDNCNIKTSALSSASQPLKNLDTFKTTSVSLNTGTGSFSDQNGQANATYSCPLFEVYFGVVKDCSNSPTEFYDSTFENPTSWKWDFGDPSSKDNTSVYENPTHTYISAGTYMVKLVAGNGSIQDSITKTVTIYQSPTHIKTVTDSFCLGDSINLKALGIDGKTFAWTSPPGSPLSDSTDSAIWVYPYQNTVYKVNVTASNGCTDHDTFKTVLDTLSKCGKPTTISGIINSYAAVLADYDSCFASLTLDTASFFTPGSKALLIQMKGATIDTSNTSSFGTVTDIGNAGNYEYVTIDSVSGQKVYLHNPLLNSYDVKGMVQLVTVPQYTSVIVSAPGLTAQPWNGTKGGVLTFEATGNIYMSSNIDVTNEGFMGGVYLLGNLLLNGPENCHNTGYFYPNGFTFFGPKGEGVAAFNDVYYSGRGANANGGGGGNSNGSGGGGGGNYGGGGIGGLERETFCGGHPSANGGIGGTGLVSFIKQNRIFPGGGGGIGSDANFSGYTPANGGGIILIKANNLFANGNKIISNGKNQTFNSTARVAGDGGGAGGTILLDINNFPVKAQVQIKGGNGLSVNPPTEFNTADCAGPGGGGGGGTLLLPESSIPKNLSWSASPGQPGIQLNSVAPCYKASYGADSGTSGGVVTGASVNQNTVSFARPYVNITTKNQSICYGDSVKLTAFVYRIKSLSWSPAATIKNPTLANTIAFPTVTTTYKLTVVTNSGCTVVDSVKIIVAPPKPVTPVIINSTVADNADILLNIAMSNLVKVAYLTTLVSVDGGPYAKIAQTKPLTTIHLVNDSLLTTTHSYTYVVVAVDSCGKTSDSSVKHSPVLLQGTPGNLENILRWKNYIGYKVDSIVLQRLANDSSAWVVIARPNTNAISFIDSSKCGIASSYRIITYGNKQVSLSDTITLTSFDTVPPARVGIVSASVTSEGNIALEFTKVLKKTTRKYLIYVKKNHGVFVLTDSVLAKNMPADSYIYNYKINTLTDTFSFEVLALDSCGNLSKTADIHRAIHLNGKALEDSSSLSWSKYKGFSVSNYIIQKWSGTGWTDYKTLPGTDSVFSELEHCNVVQNFRIKAEESGNVDTVVYSDSIQTMPFDTVAPAVVSVLNDSVADNNHIILTFNKVPDADAIGYVIYRSQNNGAFTDIDTIKRPVSSPVVFRDSVGSTITDTFSYKVYAFDSCGNTSKLSQEHRAMQLVANIKGCEKVIYLSWSAYLGGSPVEKYAIFRSVNGGAESLFKTVIGTATIYNDSQVDFHDRYCYRILAYDNNSSETSWSNRSCNQTSFIDTPQIIAVTKTVTSATNGSVVVKWKGISGPYLASYKLYYSADGKNYHVVQSNIPLTSDSIVHSGINTQSESQFYYLVAVDSCGTQSDSALIHKTITLKVSVGELIHILNWTPYSGFKIKRYKIERLVGTSFFAIDSVSGADTSTKYFPAPCNHVERYRIEAVGYNPGEISFSDTMGRKAIDTIPPNAAKIISLSVLNPNTTQLNFISSDSPDVYKYVVERAVNGVWGTASDFITHLHGAASSYIDTISTTSNKICYAVIALDSCLNVALSDTVCSVALTGIGLNCRSEVTLYLPRITAPPTKPDSFAVYRSTDNINYNKISQLPITYNTDVDTDVTVGNKYYYKLATIYHNAGMTSYSDTISIIPQTIPFADSAQLVYATVLKSDETNGAIFIQWKRALRNDSNARGYYVYSLNPANGKYALLKDVTDLSDTSYIQDNINTLQNVYKYYIVTYNVCDVGINSNIHRTVLLKVQNNNLDEKLNWINYLGIPVKTYSVYKSEDGGPQNLVNNAGLDSVFADSNITCNHNYTYQIQAVLANGEISFSDSITVKSFDTITPRTKPITDVTVIRTDVTDGKIKIDWSAATDKNLAGYNVYRSIDRLYWSLIIDHWPGTSLIDTGLNTYRQAYYYKIQPVDSCGNTGTSTIYHESLQLTASTNNGFNQLSWNGYVGWTVRKYLVYKNGVLIDTLANNVFAFKDTAVICNTVYQYLIKGIDSVNDTIISASNTDSAKAINHYPPQKVYIKTVTVSKPNKAASISWTASKSYDVKNYFVYRKSEDAGSSPAGNLKFVDSTTDLGYIDSFRDIPASIRQIRDSDCYYVFARDHCGNSSDASNQGCIIILNAKNQPGYNDLSWNSYRDWYDGVQSYNVYKNEDSTGWQLIGTTSSVQVNEFKDSKLGDSTIDFCYQVQAIENPGQYNQLSRSTVECVHQDATVFIPNTFTPYDQDGENDYFAPQGVYIKSYDMRIYNRWGELVYKTSESTAGDSNGKGLIASIPRGWDGTYKGDYVQQGVYIYLITVTDYNGKQSYFKGTITMFE